MELAEEAKLSKGTLRSKEMFRKLVNSENHINSLDPIFDDLKRPRRIRPNTLIVFEYRAKYRETLPYWDRHPLVLVKDVNALGWEGYNLHYMHPVERARVLYEHQKNEKEIDKVRMSKDIMDHDFSAICYKKYLANFVVRKPREIPLEYWEVAIQLPFEAFEKAGSRYVWNQSYRSRKRNK